MNEKNKRFGKKTYVFATLFLVLTGIIVWGIGNRYNFALSVANSSSVTSPKGQEIEKAKGTRAEKLLLVRVSVAKQKKLAEIKKFLGRLREIKKVTISPEVGGILTNLAVKEGDRVTGGETVIAEIDTTWTDLALKQAETQMELIQVQLELQKIELERHEQLRRSNAITQSEHDVQKSTVDELVVRLEAAKLSKQEAEEKLSRSKIIAPFDGYVVSKLAETGQLLTPGTNIVEIISRGEIEGHILGISEAYINRIQIGDKIPIHVDAVQGKMEGEVIAVVPYGPTGSRTFPVKILLRNEEEKLKAGMSFEAFVTVTDPREGIVVPKDAVLEHPEGETVWVAIPDPESPSENAIVTACSVPVEVRIRSAEDCLVVPESDEGKKLLENGVRVVIEGAERLSQNQRVRIIEINPEVLQNLPTASGHQTFNPQ